MSYFGDSLKRNTVCSACPPRRREQVLPSRDSLLCVHNIGLDGVTLARRLTPHVGRPSKAATPHDPLHFWRHASLRGFCMGRYRRPLAWSLGLSPAGGPHEAAAEEIKLRPTKHLALQHFQAIDMAL